MYLEDLFGLGGKVAVVTGGGRGIGQTVARGLAKAGAEVAVLCRSGADETVALIGRDGGKAYFLKTDVTSEDEVEKALQEVVARSVPVSYTHLAEQLDSRAFGDYWCYRQFLDRSMDVHAGNPDRRDCKWPFERRPLRDGKDVDRPGEKYI